MQHCDPKCGWCARDFWRWTKARMSQMRAPRKAKLDTKTGEVLRPAETVSFDECARTSVKAPKPLEDCHTRFNVGDKVLYHGDEFVVISDGGYVGLDGRHWVRVQRRDWKVYVTCGDLAPVL